MTQGAWKGQGTLAVFAVATFAAIGGAAEAQAAPKNVIVSPRAGQLLPAKPVSISVRAADRLESLTATLNGRRIGGYFGPRENGRRKLTVSPSHGLRHGTNVLRVTARDDAGQNPRRQTVRFRVEGDAPLVGAGKDIDLGVGTTIHLRERGSLREPGSNVVLRYSWRVLDKPDGSSLNPAKVTRSATARRYATTTARTDDVELDEPGTYRFRLEVEREGRSTAASLEALAAARQRGADDIVVEAKSPPAVEVDTMYQEAGRGFGIKVGKDFYPAPPRTWLQTVVLKRKNLEYLADKSKSYECANPFPPNWQSCSGAVVKDLNSLNSDHLVIVASQPTGVPPYGYGATLGRLNVDPKQIPLSLSPSAGGTLPAGTGLQPGTISLIGIPEPGRGKDPQVINASVENRPQNGRIKGHLVEDNFDNYRFVSFERPTFTTRAEPGSFDNPARDIRFRAGDGTFRSSAIKRSDGTTVGGFHVAVFDNEKLAATDEYGAEAHYTQRTEQEFGLPKTPLPHTSWQNTQQLRDTLKDINDTRRKKVVLITSVGNPVPSPEPAVDQLDDLAKEIERLGGTRNGLHSVVDWERNKDGKNTYTLVGGSDIGPGQGTEVFGSGASPGNPNAAPTVNGVLKRGKDYRFAIDQAQTSGDTTALLRTLAAPASSWPEGDDPGKKAAIAFIGNDVGLGRDPRLAYWNEDYGTGKTFDNADEDIKALKYAPTTRFSEADFDWAKRELRLELRWLGQVNNYIGKLSRPFAFQGSTQTTWAKLGEIVTEVKNAGEVASEDKTEATIGQVFKHVAAFAPLIFPASAVTIGWIAGIYGVMGDLVSLSVKGEPSNAEFETRADALQGEFVNRLVSVQDTLGEMTKVIASDYEKLKTVGTLGGCVSTAESCPREWQFSDPDRRRVTQALQVSLESAAYQSLVPARFDAWRLPVSKNQDGQNFNCFVGSSNPYNPNGGSQFAPFKDFPDRGFLAKPLTREPNEPGKDRWQVLVLSRLTRVKGFLGIEVSKLAPPTSKIVNRMFDPIDRNDPNQGGLGLRPDIVFETAFNQRTLDRGTLDASCDRWYGR